MTGMLLVERRASARTMRLGDLIERRPTTIATTSRAAERSEPAGGGAAAAAPAARGRRRSARRRVIAAAATAPPTQRSTQRRTSAGVSPPTMHGRRRASSARTCRPSARATATLERRRPRRVASSSVDLRHDEQHRQVGSVATRAERAVSPPDAVSATRAASERADRLLLAASPRARALTDVAHLEQPLPPVVELRVDAALDSARGNSARWTDALARARQVPPQLVGRHRQDRREQPRQPVGDHVHRGLRRAALARVGARTCRAGPSTRRRRTRSGRRSRTG